MPRRTTTASAFTLIELLIAVTILSMLVSILLPSLRAARAQARDTRCRAQLREYGRGFQYYLTEFRDTFPAADYGPDGDDVFTPTWFQLIDRYWSNAASGGVADDSTGRLAGLARCPDLTVTHTTNGQEWQWNYDWRTLGYGYNRYWLGWNRFDEPTRQYPPAARPVFWRRLAAVKRTSECLLVGDSPVRELEDFPGIEGAGHYLGWAAMVTHGAGVDTRHGARSDTPTVPSREYNETAYYRDGRGNLVWVDGHVSARTSLEINDKVRWRKLWDPEQRGN